MNLGRSMILWQLLRASWRDGLAVVMVFATVWLLALLLEAVR